MHTPEVWKPVLTFEGFYEVSNNGGVRSLKRIGETQYGVRSYGGNTVSPIVNSRGYFVVNLTKRGKRRQFYLHKLVLEAFVGIAPHGMQCCHNNGNKSDCCLGNLRWDSSKANMADKIKHGTGSKGEKNPNAALTDEAVLDIRASHESLNQLAARHGVSRGCVEKVKYGSTWGHV